MNKSHLIGALCAGVFGALTMSSSALAVTADNVKCSSCVNKGDLAKKAVTSSKIKPEAVTKSKIRDGAVTESKLSGSLLDLIQSQKRYVIVDSGDQVIGGAIGDGEGGVDPLIMSPQGYIATISVFSGIVKGGASIFYTGIDCTGTAYVSVSDSGELETGGGQFVYVYRQMIGEVTNLWGYDSPGNQVDYWYVPKTPTLVNDIQMVSLKHYDAWTSETVECYPVSHTIPTAAEAFPNDPAITGIPNTAFSAPLRYDYR